MASLVGFHGAVVLFVGVVAAMAACGVEAAPEGVHHLVGDDQGWVAASNVGSWSAGRTFRVGDNIWFAYSVAQDSVVELGSEDEFQSCNLTNPIRMYTSGLDRVSLDGEGLRYFTSSKPEVCKDGLKLQVNVLPLHTMEEMAKEPGMMLNYIAAGPQPSGSTCNGGTAMAWILLALFCFFGF